MQLIPFEKNISHAISYWSQQEEYRRFFCSFNKMLTKEEAERFPEIIGCEVLFIAIENDIIGMVLEDDDSNRMTKFAILIDKSSWGKGFGSEALEKIEKYCSQIKKTRILFTHAFEKDEASNKELLKQNFIQMGKIQDFTFIKDGYESVFYYYKLNKE